MKIIFEDDQLYFVFNNEKYSLKEILSRKKEEK